MTRRTKIEAMLEAQPNDAFLQYALALELLKEGEVEGGLERLKAVVATNADYHAAHFQLGQTLAQHGDTEEARSWIEQGIEAARRTGDSHAASEMEGFLMSL